MANRIHELNARFPRRRAFITRASSGLGLALAQTLAREGWTLGLFDRHVERLASVEGTLSASHIPVIAYPGDVTNADELTVAVNSFADSHDGIDVMINNAGVGASGNLLETSVEDWRWIIDINLMGVVRGCRAALPHLHRNGTGVILNVASAAAFVSAPGMASYNASKAAVLSLSETLAAELNGAGIQVSVALPTYFDSNLLESFRGSERARAMHALLMKNASYPTDQVAHDVLDAVTSGDLYIVVPRFALRLWRYQRWLPMQFLKRAGGLRKEMKRQARRGSKITLFAALARGGSRASMRSAASAHPCASAARARPCAPPHQHIPVQVVVTGSPIARF
jgi:short-subunit dehydrogenase